MQLKDKRILITGGSMGIGLAVAKACAAQGASLVLVSRHQKDLQDAVESIEGGKDAHTYRALDVSRPDAVQALGASLKKEIGHLDGLVNCAGVYGPIGPIDEIDPNEFTRAIQVNLLGTFYMCHYLVPLLKEANRGKIVNYSGGGAAGPFPNYSAYAVSKSGVVRLTENMALELKGFGIDVNAVAPGFVVTRLHEQTLEAGVKAGEGFLQKTKEQIAQGGVSADIAAKLTVFLLSSQSDGITGKFISAPWDPWEQDSFQARLKQAGDLATLRRIDARNFVEAKA
jgi:NAD(P)-dependent dehydrogenase (short-subunit alcohol dehydrogenase family)